LRQQQEAAPCGPNSETELMNASELWNCKEHSKWQKALDRYWEFVQETNLDLEYEIENLDVATVQRMNPQQWYDFLSKKYFRWKFTAPNRYGSTTKWLKQYEKEHDFDRLHHIKSALFDFDLNDIERGLEIATRIKGLGTAGASGLLSIMFPTHFGTVDQFVVKALREVQSFGDDLKQELQRMKPEDLKGTDGIILISLMRQKAVELNGIFGTNDWTPRKIDKVLWASRQKSLCNG
jgi:hypothetical protein